MQVSIFLKYFCSLNAASLFVEFEEGGCCSYRWQLYLHFFSIDLLHDCWNRRADLSVEVIHSLQTPRPQRAGWICVQLCLLGCDVTTTVTSFLIVTRSRPTKAQEEAEGHWSMTNALPGRLDGNGHSSAHTTHWISLSYKTTHWWHIVHDSTRYAAALRRYSWLTLYNYPII